VRARRIGAAALLLAAHCGKGSAPASPGASASASASAAPEAASEGDAGPLDTRAAEAWAYAVDGGEDEDLRLVNLVGCVGLRERAGDPRLRATALRAMAQCTDFSELPWLAELGTKGSDADARAALDAIVEQAARVRRATDPEDADELHAGCAQLLALAGAKDRPAARRVRAIRALRMLADRGCVKREEIPGDLDPK